MTRSSVPRIGLLAAGLAALAVAAGGDGERANAPEKQAPRLYRVIVPVADVERAAAFYGELFGGVDGVRVSRGRHYFNCGGVVLALYQPSGDGDEQAPSPLPDHIYFAVDDLEATFARAKKLGGLSDEVGDGGNPMGEIATRPWGERSFYTRDPFGTRLCFVESATIFTGQE